MSTDTTPEQPADLRHNTTATHTAQRIIRPAYQHQALQAIEVSLSE